MGPPSWGGPSARARVALADLERSQTVALIARLVSAARAAARWVVAASSGCSGATVAALVISVILVAPWAVARPVALIYAARPVASVLSGWSRSLLRGIGSRPGTPAVGRGSD